MNKKIFTLLLGIGIIAVIIYTVYRIGGSFFAPGLQINLSQASVVKEIQSLNRLETAQFTLEKIIDAGYRGNFFQNILYGDRILLIAHADVVAGFDLSKVTENDVLIKYSTVYDDDSNQKDYKITITLPAPEVFYSHLDNTRTRVYDRRTGFLAESNKDLEASARAQAETAIKNDACEAGLLNEASKNATNQLELLLRTIGFGEVRIIIPEGTCN
jgi:hypothetical protein